jgi:hypothetical protein
MNRLKKELTKRGIIYKADYNDEYDQSESLVIITDRVIVTIYESLVLPSMYKFYDKNTYEFIGAQDTTKSQGIIMNNNPWSSYMVEV